MKLDTLFLLGGTDVHIYFDSLKYSRRQKSEVRVFISNINEVNRLSKSKNNKSILTIICENVRRSWITESNLL